MTNITRKIEKRLSELLAPLSFLTDTPRYTLLLQDTILRMQTYVNI